MVAFDRRGRCSSVCPCVKKAEHNLQSEGALLPPSEGGKDFHLKMDFGDPFETFGFLQESLPFLKHTIS